MALTQEQWFQKLKGFVPSWFFEQEKYASALFQGMAAYFSAINEDVDDHFNSVFILNAITPVLQMIGNERGISQLQGESNSTYAKRVQRITSQTDYDNIKSAVDALLIYGKSLILQSPQDALYCSRGIYCSRKNYVLSFENNEFLVVIPPQSHAPYSFVSRSLFCSRSSFVGSLDLTSTLFASIIAAINQMKSFGVMYGVVESSN